MRNIGRVAGLLLLAGCGWGFMDLGNGLSERNGVLCKDGIALTFHRWVDVPVPEGTNMLELATATEDVTLTAGPTRVEVQLFSEQDGDGRVVIRDDRMIAESSSGHAVALNGVRGTVAPGVELRLASGVGDLLLNGLRDVPRIKVDCGVGDIHLTGCTISTLDVDTGTGDLELSGCTIGELIVDVGVGDVRVRGGSHATTTRIDSGVGDVVISGGSDLGTTDIDMGVGDVRHAD